MGDFANEYLSDRSGLGDELASLGSERSRLGCDLNELDSCVTGVVGNPDRLVAALPGWVTSMLAWSPSVPGWVTSLLTWVPLEAEWVSSLLNWELGHAGLGCRLIGLESWPGRWLAQDPVTGPPIGAEALGISVAAWQSSARRGRSWSICLEAATSMAVDDSLAMAAAGGGVERDYPERDRQQRHGY